MSAMSAIESSDDCLIKNTKLNARIVFSVAFLSNDEGEGLTAELSCWRARGIQAFHMILELVCFQMSEERCSVMTRIFWFCVAMRQTC